MRVLAVASEIFPLVKTGGLADVTGALPAALGGQGIAVRTLLPAYPAVRATAKRAKAVHVWPDLLGAPARLISARIADLDLLLLDAPALFDRPGGPYADAKGNPHPDDWRRFAALARAGADIAGGAIAGWQPDLVHAHDWQAAMTPAYMRYAGVTVPSVMTVHNLAFQGQFCATVFAELGLPTAAFSVEGVEYYGDVGFLKAGLQAASAITTVSPTYAAEIATPAHGMGLDGLIRARAADVSGIVNGIDVGVWNPATDPHLAQRFSGPGARTSNQRAIEARFALDRDGAPLLTVISRLTWQKGIDILADLIDPIVAFGAKIAVLGSGDAALEGALLAAAARHHGRVGVVIGYDEPLSHMLQGGADAILVPSRFEPCGLTQLCGLRYGCLPIVAQTGGLADTVIDANAAALQAGVATGFLFHPTGHAPFLAAIERAVAIHADQPTWRAMQKAAMRFDVSWDRSAARYAALYRKLAAV